MSKLHKLLIVVFCIGVLICGLGAGFMFMEFSYLTYGGEQIVGKTNMKTENIDVAFEPAEEKYLVRGDWGWSQLEIQMDSRVPLNNVRFQVTYNTERIIPYAYLNEEGKEFYFVPRWIGGDDGEIAALMEAKDLILQNIRERRIVSLERVDIEEIVVLVNPANEEDVKLVY
ncbi:MAG: hypothetical protein NC400_05300 [Clostridium sp.]|nr:hypothetical protein [Clostridium sp.]